MSNHCKAKGFSKKSKMNISPANIYIAGRGFKEDRREIYLAKRGNSHMMLDIYFVITYFPVGTSNSKIISGVGELV